MKKNGGGRGSGGEGRGGGGGARVSDFFFTENPNLICFFFCGGNGKITKYW